MGLSTRGGARGLRKATTSAVVFSTILIIVSDFLLTRVLLIVWGSTV
jgi:phospholipid/cholesterol/gamma-HCH transport system permease protein